MNLDTFYWQIYLYIVKLYVTHESRTFVESQFFLQICSATVNDDYKPMVYNVNKKRHNLKV